jgi:hypothetical protein
MLCVLSGPEKGGIFSRAKNSKSERRSVTAITKMPIAFGGAGTMTAHASEAAVPRPRVKRLRSWQADSA